MDRTDCPERCRKRLHAAGQHCSKKYSNLSLSYVRSAVDRCRLRALLPTQKKLPGCLITLAFPDSSPRRRSAVRRKRSFRSRNSSASNSSFPLLCAEPHLRVQNLAEDSSRMPANPVLLSLNSAFGRSLHLSIVLFPTVTYSLWLNARLHLRL